LFAPLSSTGTLTKRYWSVRRSWNSMTRMSLAPLRLKQPSWWESSSTSGSSCTTRSSCSSETLCEFWCWITSWNCLCIPLFSILFWSPASVFSRTWPHFSRFGSRSVITKWVTSCSESRTTFHWCQGWRSGPDGLRPLLLSSNKLESIKALTTLTKEIKRRIQLVQAQRVPTKTQCPDLSSPGTTLFTKAIALCTNLEDRFTYCAR